MGTYGLIGYSKGLGYALIARKDPGDGGLVVLWPFLYLKRGVKGLTEGLNGGIKVLSFHNTRDTGNGGADGQ